MRSTSTSESRIAPLMELMSARRAFTRRSVTDPLALDTCTRRVHLRVAHLDSPGDGLRPTPRGRPVLTRIAPLTDS
jgi:hypothetical protein